MLYKYIMSEINSSINNLVGTFGTVNIGSEQEIPQQLVCIDTSNNRIGINTIDPSYSLHIEEGSIYINTTTTTKIIFKNLPTSSTGLIQGQLYKDTDGSLKIV